MNIAERGLRKAVSLMYIFSGAAIVVMMLLTTVDVALRLFVTFQARYDWTFLTFLKPIPGVYELVCFLGSVAAAFAMAHTSLESGHVSVSILMRKFSLKTQLIIKIVTGLLSFVLFAVISWQSVMYARSIKEWGEVSMTLQLPFYPFVYGVAFSAAAVCLVLILKIVNEMVMLKK